jgi:rod shape-determining protein MreC
VRDFLDERPLKLRRDQRGRPATLRAFLIALLLILCSGILLLLDQQGMLGPIRATLQQFVAPIAVQLTAVRDGVGNLLSLPRSEDQLRARITELEAENTRLAAELLKQEQAAVENSLLREQLAIVREEPWSLVAAEVTVRSADAARRVMTLARGTNDGVQVGMAVIGQQAGGPAALIGIVESVGPRTADVLMISDIGSRVSARVLSAPDAPLGIVQGQWQSGGRLVFEPLERSAELRTGDSVVTAGLTDALGLPLALASVPPDVAVGRITAVTNEGQRQTADIEPFVDPEQVQHVWVIISQDD